MKKIMRITLVTGVAVALMAFASASVGASTKTERFIYVDAGDYYGNYEVLKDMETGVEYICDTKHGGISPLFNCDGTMYTGW
jgi:hypothetical protein